MGAEASTDRRPKPLYAKLQPRWSGLDREGVANHQRMRLIGAMIEVACSEGGYASANIKLLSALAGVSRQTFYERFGSTEACFLAAYDHVVGHAITGVRGAYRCEGDSPTSAGWQLRLGRAFAAFATEIVAEPDAARLALVVEASGAGPAAMARMRRTRRIFERMIDASFKEAPGGATLPPLIVKGIVCGVERITRQRLLTDRVGELPAIADELLTWALSYRSVAVAALPAAAPMGNAWSGRERTCGRTESDRVRILRATARIAASGGYRGLTRAQITDRAQVSLETFDASFASIQACFLATLDLLAVEALVRTARAAQGGNDPLDGIACGIRALLRHVASDAVLQRVAFVEVFAVGPEALAHREALLQRFNELLVRLLAGPRPPSACVTEAIVGAIWGIIHHYVTAGKGSLLPALADRATYLALAPVIGADAAVRTIRGGSPAR